MVASDCWGEEPMVTHQADVCIVGGGPAGLTLALLLVRSGAEVIVAEKARSLEREYRGEILQPGALQLLDQLELLTPVRRRGGYELSRFQLVERGKVLMNIDYRRLPQPHDYLFSVPQRHILEELQAACAAHAGFRHLPGAVAHTLLRDGDRVTGVLCGSGEQEQSVLARCVVGADGRYSRVRKLAGIGYDRIEAFEHDVLWFKLPAADRTVHDVRVIRDGGSPVLVHDSYPGRLQVGWTLPHRGYRDLAANGIGPVKEAIATAIPEYRDLIMEQITSLNDLTLLDVFAGTARTWAADGLLLIGDAAHTHGPIGAQGINLALQDAAVAHEVLLAALRAGDTGSQRLAPLEARRRPAIEGVMTLQGRQAKAMLATGRLARAVRPAAAKVLAYTPLYRKVLEQIAFGDRGIQIRTDLFAGRETVR
jgi:6-methylpretetramide 4-monooxygenase